MNNIFIAKYKNCTLDNDETLVCELLSAQSKDGLEDIKLNKKASVEDQKIYYINYDEVVDYFRDELRVDVDSLDDTKIFSTIHQMLKDSVLIIKSIDNINRRASLIDVVEGISPQNYFITSTLYNIDDDLKYKFSNSNLYYLDDNKQYKFSFSIDYDDIDNFLLYEDILFVNFNLILNSTLEESSFENMNETNINDFIEGFKCHLSNNDLYFSNLDVSNFCYSVLSANFVILEGVSGIGKSRLPYEFSTFLGLNEKNNDLLFLPISPSYTEPTDLLGFYNVNSNMYVESETKLVSFLIHASQNKDKLHIVILDEMNLSSIEHYFAPFISVLEKTDNRFIRLYSDSLNVLNKNDFPSQIELFDNVRFIGTINDDETSVDISQRLLDRSLILSLDTPVFKSCKCKKKPYAPERYLLDLKTINKLVNPFEELTEKELSFFDELNTVLKKVNKNVLVSYRTLNHIAKYKSLLEEKTDEEYEMYFDILIRETVIKKLFLNNVTYLKNHSFDDLLNFLTKSKLSTFNNSIEYIKEHIDEYE